jgi:hypothetical protein
MRSRSPAGRLRRRALAALVALLASLAPAAAQLTPAGTGAEIEASRQRQLEQALEEARWHLGPWRVAPWIGIHDVRLVRGEQTSSEDETAGKDDSDLTATVGAGFRAYRPFRSEAMLAVHALPQYSWWQEDSDRNSVIGRYGVGFFGFFNRLQTEVSARRNEDLGFLSADRLVLQPIRSDSALASAQLRLAGSTALFGSTTLDRTRVLDTDAELAKDASPLLDRDRQEARVGLRYLLRSDRGYVGAGALTEQTDFVDAELERSIEGTSWYAEAALRGNNMDITLEYDQRELEAQEGGEFPGFSGSTGEAVLALHPGHRLRYQLYGRRGLGYSAAAVERYVEEQRVGAGVQMGLGRGELAVFYEQGEDRYFGETDLTEDVTGYGATLGFRVGRFLVLSVGGRTTRFEPSTGADREIREVQGGLGLSFGSAPGEW